MFTISLCYSILTLAIGTTLFGYSIAELNAPEKAIRADLGLNNAQLGLSSSIFAFGGLMGALFASSIMNFAGPRKSVLLTSLLFLLGGLVKGTTQGVVLLVVGRTISGFAAGAVTVVVPLFISELAPPGTKGRLGATTQITINFGILTTQILGIYCNSHNTWRIVMLGGGALGALQAVMLAGVPESPQTLYNKGDKEAARKALITLRGTNEVEAEFESYGPNRTNNEEPENQPLIGDSEATNVGLLEFVTNTDYRVSFFLVAMIMLVQQFTGVNAVVMYGVSILGGLLPEWAGSLNATISAVNLFITLGASLLFDRISHRTLLLISIAGMTTFSAVLANGILNAKPLMSTVGIFFFVSSFSIGLGPLPWMVASKHVPARAVGSAQSIALVANWGGTGVVSFFVPIVAASFGMPALFLGFSCLGFLSFCWGMKFIPK